MLKSSWSKSLANRKLYVYLNVLWRSPLRENHVRRHSKSSLKNEHSDLIQTHFLSSQTEIVDLYCDLWRQEQWLSLFTDVSISGAQPLNRGHFDGNCECASRTTEQGKPKSTLYTFWFTWLSSFLISELEFMYCRQGCFVVSDGFYSHYV